MKRFCTLCLLFTLAIPLPSPIEAKPDQSLYASPEEAASALAQAARNGDWAGLQTIFGPGSEKLLSSGDTYADRQQLRRFAQAYDEKHALTPKAPDRVELEVGADEWPLPIPIVEAGGRWHFDARAGADELVSRRIGRNELSAIRVMLTYVEAQKDYFSRAQQKAGTGFYADRLASTPGKQNGLYWPSVGDAPDSPLGPLVEQARDEGYPGEIVAGRQLPYQGYYFRILQRQGLQAPGGKMNYMRNGQMKDGFALLAWPATYASSGIMSFEVNQDGVVFQKDLGPDTGKLAAGITAFDPDLSWARVDVTGH